MSDIAPTVVIYHNSDCGTSRNTLALIRQTGIEPHVVEYLKTPPSRTLLKELVARIGAPLRDLMRHKGTPYAELGLDDPVVTDEKRLDAIEAHPILINRPIVVGPRGVKLCRPSDAVLDLLPSVSTTRLLKEEGVPFLRDARISADMPELAAALHAESLPITDLSEPGRTFFSFRTLDGELAGFGGYEIHGSDAIVRSVVVPPSARKSGIGRNIVPLLLFRAYEANARRAWLLTDSAVPFFTKLGFKAVDRATAPPAILASRQAAELCPASATLMSRQIGF